MKTKWTTKQIKKEAANKFDGGEVFGQKLRYDLLPPHALAEVVKVYTYGSTKYGDGNYLKGMSWGRVFGALMRHAWAFWRGEDLDQESGLPHMAHAAWHCFTLIWFTNHMPNKDDRYKP